MSIKKAYNFKEANELASCSGTLKYISLQSLADEGYAAVINLLPDDAEYAVKDEKKKIENLGIHYKYIPVDWNNPKQSDFETFEVALNGFNGKKVHIHCAANYRVSAFYAIYAFKNQGWSETVLREFIGSIWQLAEYPVWNKFVSDYIDC